jgi:hypothetical protein
MSKSPRNVLPLEYASPDTDSLAFRPLTESEELRYKQYLYEVTTYGSGSDFDISFVATAAWLAVLVLAACLLPRWAMYPISFVAAIIAARVRAILIDRKWEQFEKDHRLGTFGSAASESRCPMSSHPRR